MMVSPFTFHRDAARIMAADLKDKEATASVLEASLPRSRYRQHGERVVQGHRLM